jgi:hypothetical protein
VRQQMERIDIMEAAEAAHKVNVAVAPSTTALLLPPQDQSGYYSHDEARFKPLSQPHLRWGRLSRYPCPILVYLYVVLSDRFVLLRLC